MILSTKDDSSVFFIGESFFDPLYPFSILRYTKIEIEFYRFDIVLILDQSLFPPDLEDWLFVLTKTYAESTLLDIHSPTVIIVFFPKFILLIF